MIAEFESRILALIDDMVEHASDDELFASGYLRGHLTLAVAALEAGDDHSADAVHAEVTRSPGKRYSGRELSPRDQSLVLGMWIICSSRRKRSKCITALSHRERAGRGHRPHPTRPFSPSAISAPTVGLDSAPRA